jgi:hypothetical protein
MATICNILHLGTPNRHIALASMNNELLLPSLPKRLVRKWLLLYLGDVRVPNAFPSTLSLACLLYLNYEVITLVVSIISDLKFHICNDDLMKKNSILRIRKYRSYFYYCLSFQDIRTHRPTNSVESSLPRVANSCLVIQEILLYSCKQKVHCRI